MLNKIKIKNFRSHEDTNIDLDKGINVITGESESGKTNILRAVHWFMHNRPIGDRFVRKGSKGKTEVSFTFDGIEAKRTKSKKENSYSIAKEKFDVVGTNVPEEITTFLNLDDVSVQNQHDKYFLLQDTPGEVAKRINKIGGFEIIDFVSKKVKSEIKDNTTDVKYTQNHIEELETEIKEFEHLDSVEKQLKSINKLTEKYNQNSELLIKIQTVLESIEESKEAIDGIAEWLEIENELEPLIEDLIEYENEQEKLEDLENVIATITKLKKSIQKLKQRTQHEKEVEGILALINEFNVQRDASQDLTRVLNAIIRSKKVVDELDKEIEQKSEQLDEIFLTQKLCPFCGEKLSENGIEHIKHNL